MPSTQLTELAQRKDLDAFEARCLEYLEAGSLKLADVVAPLQVLAAATQSNRIATLGQMVLENSDPSAEPAAAVRIAGLALLAAPDSASLRKLCADQYRRAYGTHPGFDSLLEGSGLLASRPAANALRLLNLSLTLQKGDVLISRTEDVVVEVLEIDTTRGLFTLKRGTRPTTLTAVEMSREYDRVDPNDFRVLRQLRPERIAAMIENDRPALIIGLIHAHGGMLDSDALKAELVPAYIAPKDWAKWWSSTRTVLKRSPHIIVEGRSPVILRYTAEAQTLEDDTWAAFEAGNDPSKWLSMLETYLREKKKEKQPPDPALLERCHNKLVSYVRGVQNRRPAEALACALVIARIEQEAGLPTQEEKELAVAMLRSTADPATLISKLEDKDLWDLALTNMAEAYPQDWGTRVVTLIPRANAVLLDRLIEAALPAGLEERVREYVRSAVEDPLHYPELVYWMWKGSAAAPRVGVPDTVPLFLRILDTLTEIARTPPGNYQLVKDFRARVKTAFGLQDFARARACFEQMDPARAVTVKPQLQRLEGLGDVAHSRLVDLLRTAHPTLWASAAYKRTNPWEDEEVLWTTQAGLQRRTEERDHLVNVTMRDNARRIGEAASYGDLSENSEYKFALEERDLLRARLAQMNTELSRSQVIEPHDVPSDHVGVGTRVVVRDASTGKTREISFLGPFDADVDRGIYNYHAPMSQKLMGLRPGESAMLTLDGHEARFEVVEIRSALPETPGPG